MLARRLARHCAKNAEWLKRWASTKILVEGHCDARGTNEYNLALGEKRAAAVRAYLDGAGHRGRSRPDRHERRRVAVLPGRERELLRAEPERPLHPLREVGRWGAFHFLWCRWKWNVSPSCARVGRNFLGRGARVGRGDDRPSHHDVTRAGRDGFRGRHRPRLIILRPGGRARRIGGTDARRDQHEAVAPCRAEPAHFLG